MDRKRSILYYHEDYLRQTQTPGHPESPDRVKAIMALIEETGIPVDIRTAPMLPPEDLEKVHTPHHIRRVREFGIGHMDPDTFHYDHTFDMALRAAGGVVSAVDDSITNLRPTFVVPRPPGHHAGGDYNMGFCYFNNVALAARKAIEDHDDIERVAIVDIDGHHGNGTNDIFHSDADVLYISIHQWGIFPGTGHQNDIGRDEGVGRTVNLPFMSGAGDLTFKAAMDDLIIPVLDQHSPDLVLVSLGVDAHLMDPLTSLSLSTQGFLELTMGLRDVANRTARGRITFELEGGYHLGALAEVFVGAMAQNIEEGPDVPFRFTNSRETTSDTVRLRQFRDVQASYWKL